MALVDSRSVDLIIGGDWWDAGDGTGSLDVDVVCRYDGRFDYTFDNELNEPNGYLDGPEEYLDAQAASRVAFAEASADNNITRGYVEIDSTVAELGLSFDGGETWSSETDVASIETSNDFPTSTVQGRVGLERTAPDGARDAAVRI